MARNPDRRKSFCVRFPPEMHDRVSEEASARGVSVNWFVNRLVSEGMERLIPAEDIRLTQPRKAELDERS